MKRALLAGTFLFAAAGLHADWFDAAADGRPADGARPPAPAEAPAPGETVSQGDRFWLVLPASGSSERTRIARTGVSIEEVGSGTVSVIATQAEVKRLEALGIRPQSKLPLSSRIGPLAFPQPDAAFHDYKEVLAELNGIASAHPQLASVFTIGTSVEGKALQALRFNSTASGEQPSEKPGIVFLGTHHAREHLSTEVPLRIAKWLAANRERADVKRLLETRDVYFIPLVNPDGAEYDHAQCRPEDGSCSYRWQRKNMRRASDGSVEGVDLNRNYGFGWGGGGASTDPDSDTYRGPAAFSEPESQAVKSFVEKRKNLKILLSYHTFSELILWPWGHLDDEIDDKPALKAYKAMGEKMAGWTGYRPMQSSGLYIASGDTCDWAWGEHGIFAFTFELTPKSMWNGGFYPGAGVIDSTVEKNIQPALYLIELADDPYRAGKDVARRPWWRSPRSGK